MLSFSKQSGLRNDSFYHIYFLGLKLILAFCSISYELLLAQSLSAFLENTVLRYSVTIGIYMFALGVGAMLASTLDGNKRTPWSIVSMLLSIEILLTIMGGFSVMMLHAMDFLQFGRFSFTILAHSLIILIGVLTGFELPLMLEFTRDHKNVVIAVDYLGAFVGTILFAFIFYPLAGLLSTSLIIGMLNAAAGLSLVCLAPAQDSDYKRSFYLKLYVQLILFMILVSGFMYRNQLTDFFVAKYLGG